jgi:hypothetical protein
MAGMVGSTPWPAHVCPSPRRYRVISRYANGDQILEANQLTAVQAASAVDVLRTFRAGRDEPPVVEVLLISDDSDD